MDELDVMVCVRGDQEIPGGLRAAWLRELHPKVRVREVEDLCDDDNSERWAAYTRQLLGRAPEVVFTSEEYGPRYARYLGSEHVEVDLRREKVTISGTRVRADPLGCWEYLEPCVRAYFARRVCVVGAESTGTTTTARLLAEHYGTCWVPEYGRSYAEQKLAEGAKLGGIEWRTEDFVLIARGQQEQEDRLARECNGLLLCDTDALATHVWHERYLGHCSEEVSKLAAARSYALYLLTDHDIPFEQDGTRDGEHVRSWMTGRFQEELERRGRPYVLLSGSLEARLEAARAAIDPLLKPPAREG